MSKTIIIDFGHNEIEDINAVQVTNLIVNYMKERNNDKFIINMCSNKFTDKMLHVFINFILKDDRVIYLNMNKNYLFPTAKSRKLLGELDELFLEKLILVSIYYEGVLSGFNLTREKLEILKRGHSAFLQKYSSLNSIMVFESETDSYDRITITDIDYIRETNYIYYYCKYCYTANIFSDNFSEHCSHNCDKPVNSYGIKYISETHIPCIDKLNKICIANNMPELENFSRYPDRTQQQFSKRILKGLVKNSVYYN